MTPSQLRALTPADIEAIERLKALKATQAAQATIAPPPGSPGFVGPQRPPASQRGLTQASGVVGRGLGKLGTAGVIVGGALEGASQVEGLRDLRRGDLSPGEWVQDYYAPSVAGPLAGSIPTPSALQRTKQAYEEGGVGGMLANIGKEAVAPIYNTGKAVGNFLFGQEKDFSDSAVGAGRDAGTTTSTFEQGRVDNTRPITPGFDVSRFTHDIGDQQLRTYTTPQGSLSGMVPAGRGRGGFVGASTDAEAARNLQARFAQDEAARRIAQSTDRAIESMRDVRAEQRGMPRAALDAQEGRQPQQPMDPDMARFLLDQAKFESQQGIDRARLGIEQGTLENKQTGTALQEQEYRDTQRAAFMQNFSYPDENAPRDQIAADVWTLHEATEGVVPPEIVARFYQALVEEVGIDWDKGGPADPIKFNEEVMRRMVQAFKAIEGEE